MTDPEEKKKRAKRRADNRRKNLRDALPRLHKDTKDLKKQNDYENDDGGISR